MFDSIGWGEIIVLALAALFIFGPERLPGLAKEAAEGIKRIRTALTGVRTQVNESLGDDLPGLRDLDLRKYHPKTFIRTQLLGDDDDPSPARRNGSVDSGLGPRETPVATTTTGAAGARDRGTPPPFDVDAT